MEPCSNIAEILVKEHSRLELDAYVLVLLSRASTVSPSYVQCGHILLKVVLFSP